MPVPCSPSPTAGAGTCLGHLERSQSHPAARGSDRRFGTRGHHPVGCKCHSVPQKDGKHSIPIPELEFEVALLSGLMAAGSSQNRNCPV